MLRAINSLSFNSCKRAVISTIWRGACLAIRVAAYCLAVFGSFGKNSAKEWRRKAARLSLIYISHNEKPFTSPLPLLMPMRNLPQRKVVRSNADIAVANILRKRFLALPFVDQKLAQGLRKATFHGAKAKGICFGASLYFLKRVLKARCMSEKQLLDLARRYKEGFCAKTAGMHTFYLKLGSLGWDPEASPTALQGMADLAPAQERLPMLQKLAAKTTQFARLAQLMGLKLKPPIRDFLRFDCNASVRSQFNALPKGVYELGFLTRSSAHSMAYLNLDFGSYLLDPNRGLMKCDAQNPAKDLVLLLKEYPGRSRYADEGAHQLEVYPYELIPW